MRQRNIRRKYYLLAIIFLGLFFYAYCSPDAKKVSRKRRTSAKDDYANETHALTTKLNLKHVVVVHIDLKRTPVKLSYLEQLLIILKQEGTTGLLMEYEDMFPYVGELVSLRNPNYYLGTELTDFLKACQKHNLEVIPLVQTFSHMENVLRLDQFRHLREEDAHEDSICPSKSESLDLIKTMLSQNYLLRTYPHSHLDSDNSENISKNTNVLIWDDMLRSMRLLPNNPMVEPVLWSYNFTFNVTNLNVFKFNKAFSNLWIASAYKGLMVIQMYSLILRIDIEILSRG